MCHAIVTVAEIQIQRQGLLISEREKCYHRTKCNETNFVGQPTSIETCILLVTTVAQKGRKCFVCVDGRVLTLDKILSALYIITCVNIVYHL